ncbi:hypothetical protein BDZ45DRAFT_422472 [Acephala macrosclerotiorum]|nr:hypothetical protein BDZ45DRAFT_422472 [Acephala macrosclerotiorum]
MVPPQPPSEEMVKIDSDGDVLFIVSCGKLTARLLVSSKVLSLASPVFAAMFSPRFEEGSSLNSGYPSEVPLPEDDPEAMTLLCNCLHFRTDHIPRNVKFSQLKALAVLCDKYNVAKAISAWSILWLQKWETSKCEDGFEGLLAVAYALDCAEAFAKLSKKAILNQVGPFDTHRVLDGFDMVPKSLLVDLEVQRGAVQASLQKAIEDVATPILTTTTCKYRNELAHAYFRGLHGSSLWPLSEKFRQASLSTIMQRISWIPESNSTRTYCQCDACEAPYKPLLLEIKAKHLSSITSLCLDCIKGGGSNLKENNRDCRFAHSEAAL